jgi:hypothetical protein
MKLFSIRRLIGLGAIYGAVQYARRHGGPKNAFNELLGKAKDKINEAKDFVGDVADKAPDGKSDFAAGSGSFASEDRLGGANAYGGYSSGSSNGRRGY